MSDKQSRLIFGPLNYKLGTFQNVSLITACKPTHPEKEWKTKSPKYRKAHPAGSFLRLSHYFSWGVQLVAELYN